MRITRGLLSLHKRGRYEAAGPRTVGRRARRVGTALAGALLPGSLLVTVGLLGASHASALAPTTITFNYNGTDGTNGSAQTWTVPAGVFSATFDVSGAQGASVSGVAGGSGGEA